MSSREAVKNRRGFERCQDDSKKGGTVDYWLTAMKRWKMARTSIAARRA